VHGGSWQRRWLTEHYSGCQGVARGGGGTAACHSAQVQVRHLQPRPWQRRRMSRQPCTCVPHPRPRAARMRCAPPVYNAICGPAMLSAFFCSGKCIQACEFQVAQYLVDLVCSWECFFFGTNDADFSVSQLDSLRDSRRPLPIASKGGPGRQACNFELCCRYFCRYFMLTLSHLHEALCNTSRALALTCAVVCVCECGVVMDVVNRLAPVGTAWIIIMLKSCTRKQCRLLLSIM
jgi:hypothetical protein